MTHKKEKGQTNPVDDKREFNDLELASRLNYR